MRLVASPVLQPEDIEALTRGEEQRNVALRLIAVRSIANIEDSLISDRLNTLAWLSAAGLLEVKIAIRKCSKSGYARGIFHEKAGIFTDSEGDHVAFAGSSNETAGGLMENFESLKTFTSWNDSPRVDEELENFEALWRDETPGLEVLEFTEVSRNILDRYRDLEKKPPGLKMPSKVSEPKKVKFRPPPGFALRPYQEEAIRAWSEAGGKGIFAMATGSGKTFTALSLAQKVSQKNRPLVIIVICPYLNLCKQWIREISGFGLTAIPCFSDRHRWTGLFEEGYQGLALGLSNVLAIVTTNRTFQGDAFQSHLKPRLKSAREHHLLIADEVHNLGGPKISRVLAPEIDLRLGLSATPERHLDPEGTQALLDYFGDIVFEYPISQAIAEGRLCPYRYHPILVSLTDEEADEYDEITSRLGPLLAGAEKNAELKQAALSLLIRRARILANAENKLSALDTLIGSLEQRPKKALFYCGDGQSRDAVTDEETRQIQAVARILGDNHGMRVRTFTCRESTAEREEILRDLASGFLDGIVAIRCLDEGIDLPDLRMGFILASSTNPRQFIQRRGRLLRNAQGKRRSEVFDFVISPPECVTAENNQAYSTSRALFARELSRISAFCQHAQNGPSAMGRLTSLRKRFGVIA